MDVSFLETLQLDAARIVDSLANDLRRFAGVAAGEILIADRRHFDLDVDAVEERAGDGKVEILATLPAERALRGISVALGSTPGAEVYQLGLQQDAVVSEGDFAGFGYRSAAHKAGIGNRVMWRAKGTSGDDRHSI